MKAIGIEWDVDFPEDLDILPQEILIPDGIQDVDEISDYISDYTGFCHISLYSVQINSSINNIKLSGLLKWLGYNAGGKHRIVFSLGKNEDVTCGIDAWTGTFMIPRY